MVLAKRQEIQKYPVCPFYIPRKNAGLLHRKRIYPPGFFLPGNSPRENRCHQIVVCYRGRRVLKPYLLTVSRGENVNSCHFILEAPNIILINLVLIFIFYGD